MRRPSLDRRNARRVLPFAAAASAGVALAALPPSPPLLNVLLAALLLAAVAGCSLFFRWAQPPAPLAVVPPLAFLVVVALLRGDNGTGTGFGPLALLSVLWIALYGRRWQLLVVLAGVGVLFALPLTSLVGEGHHAADLRNAIVWVLVSALVGLTAQALVGRERDQRRSLAAQNEFLDAMFAAAGSLVAVLEPDGRVGRVNPACERLGGFAEREISGRFFWDVLLPPDQRRDAAARWSARPPAERTGVTELAMVSRDGREHTIHWTLEALRDGGGEIGAFIATGLDVSAQRRAEAALAESEYQLRTVVSHLPGTVVSLYDRDLRCLMIEGSSLTERGVRPSDFVGRLLEESVPAASTAALRPALEAALRGEPGSLEYGSHRDETIYEVEVLPYERDGEIAGALTVSRDITQQRRFEGELQHLAEHDPLTGLLNRRRFEAELRRHLSHSARYGAAGALLMLDVDNFKAVNDSLGHARGDEVMVAIARTLDAQLRAGDSAARLGGDEFAILLPAADRAEAEAVGRRLLAAVRGQAVAVAQGPPRPITVSVGATTFAAGSPLTPEQALVEADLAMYEAKAAGGDDLRLHDSAADAVASS